MIFNPEKGWVWWLRKIILILALGGAGVSLLTYFVAVYLPDGNQWLTKTWRLSASAGLFGWIFEMTCRYFDAKESEKLRGELAVVSDRTSVRFLSAENRSAITDALKSLKSVVDRPHISVSHNGFDPESEAFSIQILFALNDAGYANAHQMLYPMMNVTYPMGVVIRSKPEHCAVASDLRVALLAAGVDSTYETLMGDPKDSRKIEIFVGSKHRKYS